MRQLGLLSLSGLFLSFALAGEITVQRVQGEVSVRQGVTEVWTQVSVGDVLRPDDTMKTGRKGGAVLLARGDDPGAAPRKIMLPSEVIVDMSDLRVLSQEELMLKLTMEKVRASSYQWKNNELHIPNAAVVHGAERSAWKSVTENELQTGLLQFNGTRVLFDHGFYSTCVLKAMEIFRLYPPLGTMVRNRFLVAEALEKADLKGEALAEYGSIAKMEDLTPEQQGTVRERMSRLRR